MFFFSFFFLIFLNFHGNLKVRTLLSIVIFSRKNFKISGLVYVIITKWWQQCWKNVIPYINPLVHLYPGFIQTRQSSPIDNKPRQKSRIPTDWKTKFWFFQKTECFRYFCYFRLLLEIWKQFYRFWNLIFPSSIGNYCIV